MAITAHVDDAVFKRNLDLYLLETSKTIEEAVNFKLYDGAREALKQTPKADKGTIKEALEKTSSKYPRRNVAEMIVIKEHLALPKVQYDIYAEEIALIKRKSSHVAFVKSGWLPAIRELLKYVGKSFASFTGVRESTLGGAEHATKTGSTVKGSIYNDVDGSGNKGLVQSIKEQGGQAAVDKINSDIVNYLSKKFDEPAEHFNKA